MGLPEASTYPFTPELAICRVLNGLWQVSGAHGQIDPEAAIADMFRYHDAGFTTWDLADHYGPAELLIGEFRRRLAAERGPAALDSVQSFTKWVPRPGPMPPALVRQAVERSLSRMDCERLDLLQFHWWEYRDPAYLDALQHLAILRDEGLLRYLGLTNFDTRHLAIIREAGIRCVSNQVQFSVIDQRPRVAMQAFCIENEMSLLAYGTLCGGLLSDRYLGAAEPAARQLNTASLRKYKQMIDLWGGWALFQRLLRTLEQIARQHQVSIANVAVRFVLEQEAVAGVIAGARLGLSEHRSDNSRLFSFALTDENHAAIASVTAQANDLFAIIGDCGYEYRR